MRSNFIPKIVIGFTIACVLCGCGAKKSYQVEVDLSVDNTESEMEEEFDTELESEEDDSIERELSETEEEIVDSETVNLEENCEQLIKEIEFWEYTCLYWNYKDVSEKTIDFSSDETEKAILATVTTPCDTEGLENSIEETRIIFGGYEVQEVAQKIFGSDINENALPETGMFAEKKIIGDYAHPVRVVSFGEDECKYQVISQNVFECEDGYDVEQILYCGYWGGYVENQGNYQVTFHLKKDKNAFYGVVLSEMSFVKTDGNANQSNTNASFYGIWCCGVKNEADANDVASVLATNGYDAKVVVSSDWSNLNPDKWYVVTSGMYSSEDEAKNALVGVKAIGYKDAYVKYSGEYVGN